MTLTAIGFGVHFFDGRPVQNEKIAELEIEIKNLTRAIQIERDRQQKIQKVVAIINRFNPEMELSQKQEIAKEICEMTLKYSNLQHSYRLPLPVFPAHFSQRYRGRAGGL